MQDRGHKRYTKRAVGSLAPTNSMVNRTAVLAEVTVFVPPLAFVSGQVPWYKASGRAFQMDSG